MSVFDLELTPPEPTDMQKVAFRRAVMAGIGRTSLDPMLKIFIDKHGYGAITKERVKDASGKCALQETEVYLGIDGVLSVDTDTQDADTRLARIIQTNVATRERKEAIDAYCAATGRSRIDAEMVIFEHTTTRPGFAEAACKLVHFVNAMAEDTTPSMTMDAFAFGDLTERITRSYVAL